ncbi:permease [Sneathiella glossodoripedis]|uniref:permease n=1 Tax=Sneathiella glossodoripedis TaxID=418853 RepID=UPI000A941205|nr:permease [Sneathiella glossodoripedis]
MSEPVAIRKWSLPKTTLWAVGVLAVIYGVLAFPEQALNTLQFVAIGLLDIAPLVIPGIVIAAWIIASGADAQVAAVFEGRTVQTVIAASMIGAITPVCGITVLPLMAGLLTAGVPLAPVMAFWLSSPITDPAMLMTTAATLGPVFAIGKTTAAFGLGILGGVVTSFFSKREWALNALRDNRLAHQLAASRCGSDKPLKQIFGGMWIDNRHLFGSSSQPPDLS